MIKTIDQKDLVERKAQLEKEFNEKAAVLTQKTEEWKQYVKTAEAELIRLQGAYQALNLLLESAKK